MTPYYSDDLATVLHGDCLEVMADMEPGSVDAVVCDPPYELGFMGKTWDASGVAYRPETWAEVLRVLKPGGHLLAFGGTRTFHRMTTAIEDAGFEVRDCLSWMYGSGFPKSLDVSKAIDKAAGAEREVVGKRHAKYATRNGTTFGGSDPLADHWNDATAPATDAAREWAGWGTALKPAWEPIVMARKPFRSTVAQNVLEHGTGALNIDGTRIGTAGGGGNGLGSHFDRLGDTEPRFKHGDDAGGSVGRWPANVVLDEHAAAMLDAQSGVSRDGVAVQRNKQEVDPSTVSFNSRRGSEDVGYGGEGGASRFFYTAKASKADRGTGNTHPTVKPISLMRWLVRMVTPPGGTVLDPFAGSGSTLVAAVIEGFQCVGIEREDDYVQIIRSRLSAPIAPVLDFGAA
jgi:DNA modification methylase